MEDREFTLSEKCEGESCESKKVVERYWLDDHEFYDLCQKCIDEIESASNEKLGDR